MAYQAILFHNHYCNISEYIYKNLTYIKHKVVLTNDNKIDEFFNLMEDIIECSNISITLSQNCDSLLKKNILCLAFKTMLTT
jgi:hypothetical protein